jgi:hypothetical protein
MFIKSKKPSVDFSILSFFTVPRAGVEPARITPLVFETSASTDSAIWALLPEFAGAKVAFFS